MTASFFSKVKHTLSTDEEAQALPEEEYTQEETEEYYDDGYTDEGQLAVDVYETPDFFYVKAMTAGVKKDDLEITITRESVTIRGTRIDPHAPDSSAYAYQELFWGTFSRIVRLPDEADIDRAEAHEAHGLLTIRLPKVDKYRSAKLSVV